MSTDGRGSSSADSMAPHRRDESNLPYAENPHDEGGGGDNGAYDKQSAAISGGILPQSLPSDMYDTTGMADQVYPPHGAPQSLRYFPETSLGEGGSGLSGVGMSGYSQMPQGQTGGFEQGVPMYPHSSSFAHQGVPSMGGKPGVTSSPIMHSSESSQYPAGGAAFSVLSQMDPSSRMPMLPPYPSHQSYSSAYGFNPSGSGYPNNMGGNIQDMSAHAPSPHMYNPNQPGSDMQPGLYDTGTNSSHTVSQLLPSSVGLGGSRSAYAASQLSAGSYGRMDMYSGLQPSYPFGYGGEQYQRPARGNHGGGRGGGRGHYRGGPRGGEGGSSYPNSPGPPILNPGNSKGPDGANLFIFHIPNDFSNQDMHVLFSEHGNVLSVRIMVEPETGRSRGFGFVSYDSAESAASAIKNLNGFAVKGKRLKVQHKQIRKSDRFHSNAGIDQGYMNPPQPPGGPDTGYLSDDFDGTEGIANESAGTGPFEIDHNFEGGEGIAPTPQDAPGDIGLLNLISSHNNPVTSGRTEAGVTEGDAAAAASSTNFGGNNESPLADLSSVENALPDLQK